MKQKEIQYKNTEKFTPEVISEVLEVKDTYGLTAENLLRKASKKSSSLYEFFDSFCDSFLSQMLQHLK